MHQVLYNDGELWGGVPLFGCFFYVRPRSKTSDCWPRFCPEAVFLPCLLYGSNTTILIDEPPLQYEICRRQPLGDTGLVVTVCAMIVSLCLWYPFSPLFCILVAYQRTSIRRIYFPTDTSEIRQWDACIGCLCAPCALYQQFEFLTIKKSTTPVILELPQQHTMP